jgi:hypothetical protein
MLIAHIRAIITLSYLTVNIGGTSKEDFFSANPQGTGLDVKGLVQKFANQKAWGNFKR